MNNSFILNEHGHRIWKHHQIPNIFLDQSYSWVDTALMIDENSGGRLVIGEANPNDLSTHEWIPMTYTEYRDRYFKCRVCTTTKTCDDCKWPGC